MRAADSPPVTYGYDEAGRLQTITQGAEVFTFAYDTLGRLERLTHADAAGQPVEDLRYTFTPDDEIASITSPLSSTRLPARSRPRRPTS